MLRPFIVLFSFLLLNFSFQTWAQSTVEGLEEIVRSNKKDTNEVIARNNLFKHVFREDIALAKKHVDEGMKLARKLNYERGIATCYHRYCILYYSYGDYDRALKMIEKSKSLYAKIGDNDGLGLCINMKANIEIHLGNYEEALKLYLESEKNHERNNDQDRLATAKHNIYLVYSELKDFEKANVYIQESLEISKRLGDSAKIMAAYNGIGTILSSQERRREAIEVFQEALRLAKRVKNLYEEGMIYNNIGVQYHFMEELDSARLYYYKAMKDYRTLRLRQNVSELYGNLGRLEVTLNNGKLARTYYDSSLRIAQELGTMPVVSKAYKGLCESNELLGNHSIALEWYKKYHHLNDSLMGERVRNNINELNAKYDAGKKDLKIAALEKSRLEANINEERDRQMMIIIIASSLLSIVLLFLLLSRRNARAKERANKLEQKVFRAQMNPHFIFNSLNSIQRMYVEGNEDRANDYMADFSHLLRSILENSGKHRISLKEELELTTNYLDLEKLRTRDLFSYTIEVSDVIDPLIVKVPPLIFQPYIENAIWHGILPKNASGHIALKVEKQGGGLLCTVTDDGVGFDHSLENKKHDGKQSKGMAITAERLGGEKNVTVETLTGGGTQVKLKMIG